MLRIHPRRDLDQQPKPAGVFSFGDSKKLADELAALVRQGIKTATCSALMGYEKDQTPLPQKGDLSIVLDGSGNSVLVIETLSVVALASTKFLSKSTLKKVTDQSRIGEWLTKATFAQSLRESARSTRRCWLFANGSKLSIQSIEARVAKDGGTLWGSES